MFRSMMTEDKVFEMVSKAQEFEQIKVCKMVIKEIGIFFFVIRLLFIKMIERCFNGILSCVERREKECLQSHLKL